MNNFKDIVTGKLSDLFADSPRKSTSPGPSPSDNPQGSSYYKGAKSWSTVFSYISPSLSSNRSEIDKQQNSHKSFESQPLRWESNNFEENGDARVTGPVSNNNQKLDDVRDEDHTFERSSSDSDVYEEATDHHSPGKPLVDLTIDSAFISPHLYEFIHASLPNIVKGCKWVLLYSTLKHGTSLRTLIRKSADLSGPCLLISGDKQGAVFGALLECPLKPSPKRKYQGTNQSFVFTTKSGEPTLFRPTGANRYYFMCLNDLLAFGGGGNFALCFDGDLLSGTSGSCDTYGNPCLAHNTEFELKNVELWGFAHASQYYS